MMNSVHSLVWPGYFLFMALHMLGMIAATVGFVFLVVWAVKKLHTDQLKRWGIVLLLLGLLVCGITFFGISYKTVVRMKDGVHMRDTMMMEHAMVSDDEGMMREEGGMMMGGDHSDAMTMGDMTDMLKGKTGNDFDKAFIEGMIVHHQGAIDMAKAAQVSAGHAEIKTMANAIISAQQSEIDMMKQWQKAWGF